MKHLSERMRAIAQKPDDQRIYCIREDKFFLYSRAEKALTKMEDILTYPKSYRPPCLLIWGPSGNGKTMILNRFADNHKPFILPQEDNVLVPVVKIQAPASSNESDLYDEIFMNLNIPHRVEERKQRKKERIIQLFTKLGVRVLVIDEFHQMLKSSATKQRRILDVIKYLSNQLQMSIIAAGTIEAFNSIGLDPQLKKRFHTEALSLWSLNDKDYHNLLHTFEVTLPLREPSLLRSKKIALLILQKTDGTIGEICDFLKNIAVLAIRTGREKIDFELLQATDFQSFTERRSVQEELRHVL